MKLNFYFFLASIILMPFFSNAQYTSIEAVQGQPAGVYTFNFGDGDFQAYVDAEGWMLWAQYHHKGGTNPYRVTKQVGTNLPMFDNSPLGTDLSTDLTKWGHGSQAFAASIPDAELWLRFEGLSSDHNRKMHFETPVLGKFQTNEGTPPSPEIAYRSILRADHTAISPQNGSNTSGSNGGNDAVVDGTFSGWGVRTAGFRWNMDNYKNDLGQDILYEYSTIHRVWVKPQVFNPDILMGALNTLHDHVTGVQTLTAIELSGVTGVLGVYMNRLGENEAHVEKALAIITDFDAIVGPLFTTANTVPNKFARDPSAAPGLEYERAIYALEQGLFDFVFTPEGYAAYPHLINGHKFGSCVAFPGDVAPPVDSNVSYTVPIRANFADPYGTNPAFGINGDGTNHAYRPTGLYLAPGSVATVTVPASLVGKDYYVRVGAHEWDLSGRWLLTRFDRVSIKFPINATTIEVFNPFGGAISILVPYLASEGIVDVNVSNVIEAPFISIKSFYNKTDVAAEMAKPGPWVVFESDNAMYTLPKHHINIVRDDVLQGLINWDEFVKGMNFVLGRGITYDKHNLYMIQDNFSRAGVNSIGYPMSNFPALYTSAISHTTWFVPGPSEGYKIQIHEHGHGIAISKFAGEGEATVNFLYVMGMSAGMERDLNESWKACVHPKNQGIDDTALERMLADSFGSERVGNDIQYQKRGFGHYVEIAKIFGWCALRNFWEQEYLDAEAGNDHGINNQDNDSRIIRMSVAAEADLRPLFEFYGIVPQDVAAVNSAFQQLNLPPSQPLYNRLNELFAAIPANNAAFVAKALEIYPNLMTEGPTKTDTYRYDGMFYQKSLTYNEAEAQRLRGILQGIIDKHFPAGKPTNTASQVICFDGNTAYIPVTGVTVNPPTATIKTTETIQLTATVSPNNATDKIVDWSSSNPSIATVDARTGLVTAIAEGGPVTITATTYDGGYKATCIVTVTDGAIPEGVVSVTGLAEVHQGETVSVSVTYSSDATNDIIVYLQENGVDLDNDGDNWSAFGVARATVNSGSDTVVVELVVDADAPIESGLRYMAFLTTVGAGWEGLIGSDKVMNDVSVLGATLSTSKLNDEMYLVYPNPTDNHINIDFLRNNVKNVSLNLYNLNGQLIALKAVNSGLGLWKMDLKDVSSGIYLLKIDADGKTTHKKIVVK